jgi:hypothetical protein
MLRRERRRQKRKELEKKKMFVFSNLTSKRKRQKANLKGTRSTNMIPTLVL